MRKLYIKHRIKRFIRRTWQYVKYFTAKICYRPLLWYYRWKLNLAIALLKNLDELMLKNHWDRSRRRRFWREFIAHREIREKTIEMVSNKVGSW